MSFTWTELIPGVGHEYSHVANLAVASGIMIGAGAYARKALGRGQEAVIPASKFSVRGVFEVLIETISNLAEMVIGHAGQRFVPMFTAIFFFVLVNNLMGIVPGHVPATENLNTTFAIGIFSFLVYNFYGIKEQGIFNYLKHFLGPKFHPAWMWVLIGLMVAGIELVSHMVRPISLGLRLGNVMMGDHAVLTLFLGLVPPVVPVVFYLLGIFVSFVQAFVFTLLSMLYVAFAVAHEEEH